MLHVSIAGGVGWEKLLRSCRLTHLFVVTRCGLTLPVDPSCYADMEHLVLRDSYFVLKPDLANALAQAKKLSELVLEVSYCELKMIGDFMNTSKSLSKFHI